mgnify:FL=1
MRQPLRLGLTGGIGAGKSTVARMLADLGAAIIDADALSRATTAPGGTAIDPVRASFGNTFITPDGAMDRDAMRTLVFADPSARHRLEAIVHPLVHQAIEAAAVTAHQAGHHCLVFDIPLLVESKRWPAQLDKVLVVDCSEQTQRDRVMARNGLALADVERIMATQASRMQRLAAADLVVFNDQKPLDTLRRDVAAVAQHFGL